MNRTIERADFIDEKLIYDTLEAGKTRALRELEGIIQKQGRQRE